MIENRCSIGDCTSRLVVKLILSLVTLVAFTAVVPELHADEVDLTDGGKVKGKIVSESPQDGIKVLLDNGTTFTVPAALVKRVTYDNSVPAAPLGPGTGSTPTTTSSVVRVSAPEAGEVFARNVLARGRRASQGRIAQAGGALDIALAPGTWDLEIKFDSGGSATERVVVNPSERMSVTFRSWDAQPWVAAHRGVHFGMMGHADLAYYPEDESVGGGPSLEVFAAVGLTPVVELRVGAELSALIVDDMGGDFYAGVEGPMGALLGFGTIVLNVPGGVYRPYIGLGAGAAFATHVDELPDTGGQASNHYTGFGPVVQLKASPLHFSFGHLRQWSLDVRVATAVFIRVADAYGESALAACPNVPLPSVGFGGVLY